MKKVLGFFKKSPQQSQQDPSSSNYHLVSNDNDNSIIPLSSVLQQQQQQPSPSQEEVRKQRLSKLDKQPVSAPPRQKGVSKDIANHPLALEFGQNAYLVHMFLEDLYLNTFHLSSLQRNPHLKLLQPVNPGDEIKLYTQENMHQDIMKFLQSDTYYTSALDKLTYLHDIYGRIGSKTQEGLILEEKTHSLQKTVLKCLMDYLLTSMTQEDPRVLTDLKSPLFDTLYTKLSAVASNGFFHQFIRNLPEEDYDLILTPIFKRMIRDNAEDSVIKRRDTLNAITLFQELINCNPKVADFLFQHELHIPKNPTGQEYQRKTVFGAFLSFTIMNNNAPSLMPHIDMLKLPSKTRQEKAKIYHTYRKKVKEAIISFQKLLESLIKINPQYKRNILDWFRGVMKANEPMQTTLYKSEDKLSSRGWFCNFFVLLLHLCENMLKDPQKYPAWISKIDLNYIYSNPIFENRFLLDGTKLPPSPPEKYQELQESKFSFGTELIFITNYAWFFLRDSVGAFNQSFANEKLLIQSKITGKIDEDSYLGGMTESWRFTSAASIQLFDPYLMEQLHRLLNFQVLLMLHAYGVNISGLQDLSSSSLLFERLQAPSNDQRLPIPKYWSLNVLHLFNHLANLKEEYFPKELADLDLLMNFMLALAMNKFDTCLQDLRTLSLQRLYMVTKDIISGQADKQLVFILKTSPFYAKNLPKMLIDTFLEAQEIFALPTQVIGAPTRYGSLLVLNGLLESVFINDSSSSYLIKFLKDLFKNDKEKSLKLTQILISDIIFEIDDLSLKVVQDQHGDLSEELKKENETFIWYHFAVLTTFQAFAANLSKNCPEFCLDDIVRHQFTACLNYSIKVFHQESLAKFINGITGVLFTDLVKTYLNLAHNDDFLQNIVNDVENFDIGCFYQVQLWSEENKALTDGEKDKFSQLIATLSLLSS